MSARRCRRVTEAGTVKAGVIGAAEWLRLDDNRVLRNSDAHPVGPALAVSAIGQKAPLTTVGLDVAAATLLLQQMQIATAELAPQIGALETFDSPTPATSA